MLDHFITAQNPIFNAALAELRDGEKRTHWMWFVFPQIAGLGHSPMARRFALFDLDAARAYLGHPVLGPRLREATEAVLAHGGHRTIAQIFGYPDDLKFFSSMTLFARASGNQPSPFRMALEQFFAGEEDAGTTARL
jgi:uncharacterized protein (DUF1810 family)